MYITFHQPRLDWKKWRVWKVQLLFVIWLVVNTHLVATICSSLSGKWSSTLRNAQVYRYTGIPCYPITTLSPTRPGPKATWCTTTGRWRAQKVAQLGTEINQRKNYKVTKFGEVVMWKFQIVMRKKKRISILLKHMAGKKFFGPNNVHVQISWHSWKHMKNGFQQASGATLGRRFPVSTSKPESFTSWARFGGQLTLKAGGQMDF